MTNLNTIEGLRSVKLEIQNFKNITTTVIDIGGRSMLFMGKNNTGKSTLIQAMMAATDSKILPSEPVKKGEERAKISHKIGGLVNGQYTEYTMDIYFSLKNKKGTVKLYNDKGEEMKSPATMIKTIIGNVSFDVTRWLNDSKDKKLKTLKDLTGCGVQVDLISAEIKKLKADRKYSEDRSEALASAVKENEFTAEEIDIYSTPKPIEDAQRRLNEAAETQGVWDGVSNKGVEFVNAFNACNETISKSQTEINRLMDLVAIENAKIAKAKEDVVKHEANIKIAKEWIASNVRPDVTAISNEIAAITAHNEKYNRIMMLGGQQKEMIKLKQEVASLKSQIDKKEEERDNIIKSSQLPIPGLSFNDEDIFINGLPLEEEQINTATLFDIGVDVAMALNPNLKIIFLHDGSLFDSEHLKSIINKIESKGYQAIVELVNESSEVEAVFTEEVL